jgi:hypothetical protein
MCWKCSEPAAIGGKPGFRDLCPACGREIHVCKNCRFYSPGAYRDCAETMPDPVNDKERMNLCEYFQTNQKIFSAAGKPQGSSARDALDKLFGGS